MKFGLVNKNCKNNVIEYIVRPASLGFIWLHPLHKSHRKVLNHDVIRNAHFNVRRDVTRKRYFRSQNLFNIYNLNTDVYKT